MLYMDRKPGSVIHIGSDIVIHLGKVKASKVRLGIEAPRALAIRDGTPTHDTPDETEPRPDTPARTVLLVEDDPAHAIVIEAALRDSGITRITTERTAADAEKQLDAIEAREADSPDVILTDLYLTGERATPLIKHIREHQRTRFTPVVVLSGSDKPDDIAESRRCGADAYITKNPDYDRFCDSIYRTISFWSQTARAN
jgi:CheY-like chemotaxis protein